MSSVKSPKQVLEAFYEAERQFMEAGGTKGGAGFADMAATLDPAVVLHQSPDLPFGGEYVGHRGYQDWADAMSAIFDKVDAQNPEFFEKEDAIVIACTLLTRTRANGKEIKLPMLQLIRVKNGKITEFRPFYWNVPQYTAAAHAEEQH